jgi:hypothetical protein
MAISTPKNMAATSDENEQCNQVGGNDFKNVDNESKEEQAAGFQELASGREEENKPTQHDAEYIENEFARQSQKLEKKRRQHKLYMDERSSFLRTKVGKWKC